MLVPRRFCQADLRDTTPLGAHPDHHQFRDLAENLEVGWNASPKVARVRRICFDVARRQDGG